MTAVSTAYEHVKAQLRSQPRHWLITGAAGFIGSNLLETLLKLDQHVTGLDNFATGHPRNLRAVEAAVNPAQWARFSFMEGDIRDLEMCRRACDGSEFVLHQAALGSVPRSIDDPITTNTVNVGGSLNMLVAARDAKVRRFVYAASSSTYGDHPDLPKVEYKIGRPLSPYAVTKYVNELFADVFSRCYGVDSIGLRYFNVFGPRQDPKGAYAAVIPKWACAILRNETVFINGDGLTSRDFCFVANAVQANLLAAMTDNADAVNEIYNVAVGGQTTLRELHTLLKERLIALCPDVLPADPVLREFRSGDVKHSRADIGKAKSLLGYVPTHTIADGLDEATRWYAQTI